MIRSDQILKTVEMIQKENLDVRTLTMGINLLPCRRDSATATAKEIEATIQKHAGTLVETCEELSSKYALPIVNKRISVTPVSLLGSTWSASDFVAIAHALDRAAEQVHIDIIGGYSANVEKGITQQESAFLDSIPEAISSTRRLCASVNAGSSKAGMNMDAIKRLGKINFELAQRTADSGGFAATKFVVFMNQPGDNPFMAGAVHGLGEADAVLNVGVSGPGVVARALKIALANQSSCPSLDQLAEEIKLAAARVTRSGQLLGRQAAQILGVPFGVVDLSLAPTPRVGDSIGEIIRLLGVEKIGAPGSTAIIALLNDAVKKGGVFGGAHVGGLSGAFIPVCEDSELADAAQAGSLTLEKLEAMTAVCSVGLDMIAVPGDTDAGTLSAIMADELAIGMINQKTTATRLIPVPGKKAGDFVKFGGLFGESVIMHVRNPGASQKFIDFGGRIPAPIHSMKN